MHLPSRGEPDARRLHDPRLSCFVVMTGVCVYLLGSLMPPVAGVSLSLVSVPVVALPLAFTLIGPRNTPRLVLLSVLGLFAVLIYFAYFGLPPLDEYGVDKRFRLVTSTLLSALCAALVFSFDRLRTFARIWVVVTAAIAFLTIGSGESFSTGRASVFDNNPIWLARAFTSGALMAIALPTLGSSRWWRLACVPLIVGLLLTGSRGPAIGLAAALAVLLIHNAVRLVTTLTGAGFVYGSFTLVPALRGTRVGQTIADTGTAGDNASRSEMWQSAWNIWRSNPSGVGIGNWSNYSGISVFSWPHNIWLEVAAELGTIAILALLASVALTFRGLIRRLGARRDYRLILALLTSESVAVSLSGDLSARTFFFLLFLGVHSILLTPRAELDSNGDAKGTTVAALGSPAPKVSRSTRTSTTP